MTTSSDQTSPSPETPSNEGWGELTATLSPESTEVLDRWMIEQLRDLETRLDEFVSPRSLCKSLRG